MLRINWWKTRVSWNSQDIRRYYVLGCPNMELGLGCVVVIIHATNAPLFILFVIGVIPRTWLIVYFCAVKAVDMSGVDAQILVGGRELRSQRRNLTKNWRPIMLRPHDLWSPTIFIFVYITYPILLYSLCFQFFCIVLVNIRRKGEKKKLNDSYRFPRCAFPLGCFKRRILWGKNNGCSWYSLRRILFTLRVWSFFVFYFTVKI